MQLSRHAGSMYKIGVNTPPPRTCFSQHQQHLKQHVGPTNIRWPEAEVAESPRTSKAALCHWQVALIAAAIHCAACTMLTD
jgi:hypothetical protein